MIKTPSGSSIAGALRRAAQAAGAVAMQHYRPGLNTTARVSYKDGGSPVTEADLAADAAIRAVLAVEVPGIPVFSEEAAHERHRFDSRRVFVVDPIDGTRAFMQGRSEWCVSIALMEEDRPVSGVILAPARGECFEATLGQGAFLNEARLPPIDGAARAPVSVTGPRPMIDRVLASDPALLPGEPLRALAYRLASIAAGRMNAAFASKGSHDWDIAAADVILAETGGLILTPSGERPVYNAADPVHPALVAAHPALMGQMLRFMAQGAP